MNTKSIKIKGINEIQLNYESVKSGNYIRDPESAHKLLISVWDIQRLNIQEEVVCLYLDNKNELISWKRISSGDHASVDLNIKLILSIALQCMAVNIIVAHNHPSGNLEESQADIESHIALKNACQLIGVKLIDALILDSKQCMSFMDKLKDSGNEVHYPTDLTPGQLELIDLTSPFNSSDMADHFERIFDLAAFHYNESHSAEDITALYFQKTLYTICRKINREQEAFKNKANENVNDPE